MWLIVPLKNMNVLITSISCLESWKYFFLICRHLARSPPSDDYSSHYTRLWFMGYTHCIRFVTEYNIISSSSLLELLWRATNHLPCFSVSTDWQSWTDVPILTDVCGGANCTYLFDVPRDARDWWCEKDLIRRHLRGDGDSPKHGNWTKARGYKCI